MTTVPITDESVKVSKISLLHLTAQRYIRIPLNIAMFVVGGDGVTSGEGTMTICPLLQGYQRSKSTN